MQPELCRICLIINSKDFIPLTIYHIQMTLTLSTLAAGFVNRWWHLQTVWIQISPNKTWGLIWDPNCLSLRFNFSKHLGKNKYFFQKFADDDIADENNFACKELKTSGQNIENHYEKKLILNRVENIVDKNRNCSSWAISSFATEFPKVISFRFIRTRLQIKWEMVKVKKQWDNQEQFHLLPRFPKCVCCRCIEMHMLVGKG